jgi:hypothetical protein
VSSEFQRLYTGRLWSVLAWDQLTPSGSASTSPPAGTCMRPASCGHVPSRFRCAGRCRDSRRIHRAHRRLLRAEHHESYCGIVYADDLENPRLIKIYDPNNLGSSCGSSKNPPGRAGS